MNLLLCVSLVIIAGLACGNKEKSAEVPQQPPAEQTSPAPAARASTNIDGDYIVNGTNPSGTKYSGNLNITKRDEVYQFSWTSGGREYDGVGVRIDDIVAVAFAEGADGKGCGVVLYSIGADGSLDGRSGYWGEGKSETERAIRTSGHDLPGAYDVQGTNTRGEAYNGKLAINSRGRGYSFQWDIAGQSYSGFGVRMDDKAAAGFGGPQCGFVSYAIMRDGRLSGNWGGQGSTAMGTEVAAKR